CFTPPASPTQAGTHPVTCSGLVDPNYTVTYTPGSLTIQAAGPITVTAPSPTITYGSPIPPLSPSYSGFVSPDTASVLSQGSNSPATCSTTPPNPTQAG